MSVADRVHCMELIDEAVASGARKAKACEILGVSVRTVERWETGIPQINWSIFRETCC